MFLTYQNFRAPKVFTVSHIVYLWSTYTKYGTFPDLKTQVRCLWEISLLLEVYHASFLFGALRWLAPTYYFPRTSLSFFIS